MKKKLLSSVVSAGLLMSGTAYASSLNFDAFNIRGTGVATELSEGRVEFVTPVAGDKAGYGTSDLDGLTFGDLVDVSFLVENAAGPWMPYINIWIGDGTNYAIIANEPSNAPLSAFVTEPNNRVANGTTVSATFEAMGDFFVYETGVDTSWLTGAYSDSGRLRISYDDLAAGGWAIGEPGVAWGGTGAPRGGFGFNFVYGDTMSNYVSGQDGYIISNITVGTVVPLPAPAMLTLIGMGVAGMVTRVRRKRSQ
ncbi:MAG: hypothetical protein KF886_15845 [Candidatus Hydrogenedentes bacterium]|nr:hypothetical protein [Candidatus Hydrogenedentota bacterium]